MQRVFQLLLMVIFATQSIWVSAADACHHGPGAHSQQAHTHLADSHGESHTHPPTTSAVDEAVTHCDALQDCGVCHLAHLSASVAGSAAFEVLPIKGEVPESTGVGAMPSPLYSIDRPNWIS